MNKTKTKISSFLQEDQKEQVAAKALLADNSKEYSHERMNVLTAMGLTETENYKREREAQIAQTELGKIIAQGDFLGTIRSSVGGEDIEMIKLTKLVEFCKKHNLLFGKAPLFKGEIPVEVVSEIEDLELSRLSNHSTVDTNDTIFSYYRKDLGGVPLIYVASSPHNFVGNKALISNTEIIESDYHSELEGLEKNEYPDSLILSPLEFNGELYFIIIKIW